METEIETLNKILKKNVEENNKKIKEEDDFICNETYKSIVESIHNQGKVIYNDKLDKYVLSNFNSWFWQNKFLEKCPNIQKLKNIKINKIEYYNNPYFLTFYPVQFKFDNGAVSIKFTEGDKMVQFYR